jgi:hypothetical protein
MPVNLLPVAMPKHEIPEIMLGVYVQMQETHRFCLQLKTVFESAKVTSVGYDGYNSAFPPLPVNTYLHNIRMSTLQAVEIEAPSIDSIDTIEFENDYGDFLVTSLMYFGETIEDIELVHIATIEY